MISASLPGEALGQLGTLPLGLYPPPPPSGMTPEFLAPPPRPYVRYNPRRRDVMPTPPAPSPYPSVPAYPFLPHPASYAPYMYRRQQPAYPIRPRASSGFVPPSPAPHSPPTASAPSHPPREQPSEQRARSPERGPLAPYFCRGALIRLEDGSYRRVEEMRTEDFVMSADRNSELMLTQCTLLRVDERGDRASLTLTYGRARNQVELESTIEHPFFVYGRGWASCRPERTLVQYGLRVQRLQVGDVCVSLVNRKHSQACQPAVSGPAQPIGASGHEPLLPAAQPMLQAAQPPLHSVHQPRPPQHPTSAPPQTHPENLSVKEDARGKRRWSASDAAEDCPPLKKR